MPMEENWDPECTKANSLLLTPLVWVSSRSMAEEHQPRLYFSIKRCKLHCVLTIMPSNNNIFCWLAGTPVGRAIPPVLHKLHWLLIVFSVQFTVLISIYTVLYGLELGYPGNHLLQYKAGNMLQQQTNFWHTRAPTSYQPTHVESKNSQEMHCQGVIQPGLLCHPSVTCDLPLFAFGVLDFFLLIVSSFFLSGRGRGAGSVPPWRPRMSKYNPQSHITRHTQ